MFKLSPQAVIMAVGSGMLAIAYSIIANMLDGPIERHWHSAARILDWDGLPYVTLTALLLVWAVLSLHFRSFQSAAPNAAVNEARQVEFSRPAMEIREVEEAPFAFLEITNNSTERVWVKAQGTILDGYYAGHEFPFAGTSARKQRSELIRMEERSDSSSRERIGRRRSLMTRALATKCHMAPLCSEALETG